MLLCLEWNDFKMSSMFRGRSILPFLRDLNNTSIFDIILASASPRRKELCHIMGLNSIRIMKSSFAEDFSVDDFENPSAYCLATATKKAEDVIKNKHVELMSDVPLEATSILISADTIVEIDGSVLEKPTSAEHAKMMIRMLSGRTHSVISSVVIFQGKGGRDFRLATQFVERSIVRFMDLDDIDIDEYVASGEPMDKSGGYGVQGLGGQFVTRIDGDFFNIMGLPIHRLGAELSKLICSI